MPLLAFGGVDLVVNNAGLSVSKPLVDTTEDDWDRQHDVMAGASSWRAAVAMIPSDWAATSCTSCRRTVVAGPDNVAYNGEGRPGPPGSPTAAELGGDGIR